MAEFDPFEDIESDRNEREKNERRISVDDMKWLLSSKKGRRILWQLMSWTGVFRLSFNHSGSIMAFNEGARYVGLALMQQVVDADPMAYATMTKEQQDYERNNTGDGTRTSDN
jgi:hypothetical protein